MVLVIATTLPGLSFHVSVLAYGIIFRSLSAWHHLLSTRPTVLHFHTRLTGLTDITYALLRHLYWLCNLCTFTFLQHSNYRKSQKTTSDHKTPKQPRKGRTLCSHKSWIIHSCLTAPHTSIMFLEKGKPYFHQCNPGHITLPCTVAYIHLCVSW